MTKMKQNRLFILLFLLNLLSMGTSAEITLPSFFSDNMVLQRNADISIWGWAEAGEQIHVIIKNKTYKAKAGNNGNWSVSIGRFQTGDSIQIRVKGKNEIILKNVLIGDVWLCSGQSNMDWSLSGDYNGESAIASANYPEIRLFKVEKAQSQHPAKDVAGKWQVCSPETVGHFSAVGYYFGKELFESQNIPIGLIQASWGGSDISTWMSWNALAKLPEFREDRKLLREEEDYLAIKSDKYEQELNSWLSDLSMNSKLLKNKNELDRSSLHGVKWINTKMPLILERTSAGDINGLVWFKTTIHNGKYFKSDSLTYLSLGKLDDHDLVFLNGRLIGHAGWKEWNRFYEVPDSLLEDGANELVIGIVDYGGDGGFKGSSNDLFIDSFDQNGVNARFPLSKNWQYLVEGYLPKLKPTWLGGINEPTILYNAMLAPLTKYALKGAIWYQGEHSKSQPDGYDSRLKALINDWREQWKQEDLPFIFVQLPNYANEPGQYPDGNWALLRHLQSKALELPNTGMAVTYDVGDPHDIHPLHKGPVGHRLALVARNKAYHENVVCSGPLLKEVERKDSAIYIKFENFGERMMVRDPYEYLRGFQTGYSENGKLKLGYSQAKVAGDKVVIDCKDNIKIEVIRYAWEDNPDANLYNESGIPAPPFEYWFN